MLTVVAVFSVFSQVPQSFRYQAIAKNSEGEVIGNKNLSFQVSVLVDSVNGVAVYSEIHNVVSNQSGMVNLNIGAGTVIAGDFTTINWSDHYCYLKTEMDTAGGSNYQFMGTSQLLSVPYSLTANRTRSIIVVDSVSDRDNIVSPLIGEFVFVLENNGLYLWRGDYWKSFSGCAPMPSVANAGKDTVLYGTLNEQFTIQLNGNIPEYGTGAWSIVSGDGGLIVSLNDPKSNFNGIIGNQYVVGWRIKTVCDFTYDEKSVLTFEDCGLLTDSRDGKTYHTVKIDTMCWMAENLNIGTRIDGSVEQVENSIIEKYCYDDSETNCDVYGGLYQWDEVMQYDTILGTQGICPAGWHIPTNVDWENLSSNAGGNGVTGGKIKEIGYEHWSPPNSGATNSYGFSALPGGNRYYNSGAFFSRDISASFWTSSKASVTNSWRRSIQYDNIILYQSSYDMNYGFSLRCMKN